MRGHDVLLSSKSDEWETPHEFFDVVDREFNFALDAAATMENTKCERWLDEALNGLVRPWDSCTSWTWCNCPYSLVGEFIDKAIAERSRGNFSVLLVPARTDTRWFHRAVPHCSVRLIKGRLKFGGAGCAPFPSALLIFGRGDKTITTWDWLA